MTATQVELVENQRRIPISKRLLDVVGSGLLLLSLLPIFLVLALVVKVTSPGPVFFRQSRYGLDGQRFLMLKFRTMREDAEEVLAQWMAEGTEFGREMAERWKLADDPRITPVGGVLRKLSLDELPQLINVLRGEMSLVGPRPRRCQAELDAYGHLVDDFLSVPPGMTGPWQTQGRNTLTDEERVQLDVEYARSATVVDDLGYLVRTIPAVLRPGDGAS